MSGEKAKAFLDRLEGEDPVLHAGGYLFEMERRGYLQAGAYVPEVVLEHPEALEELHLEFARAGSDVTLAFTYYGHREKLRLIGKEDLLEPLNREAVRIARRAAAQYPDTFVAGNICNTNVYEPGSAAAEAEVRGIFTEQLTWAAEEGIDIVVCETVAYLGEAKIAVEVATSFGLPLVLGLAVHKTGKLRDFDGTVGEACRQIRDHGATVVGVNCHRGPATMMPLLEEICTQVEPNHVCGFPVAYRTTPDEPTFGALRDPNQPHPDQLPGGIPFPVGLDPFVCTRYEMAEFARRAKEMGVRYVGGCCGTGPHHIRAMAEAMGRTTEATRYSPDMSKHYALGDHALLKQHNRDYATGLTASGSEL
jgi:betaine-homocysteine S-methyltransferase